MNKFQTLKKALLLSLTVIGGGTVAAVAAFYIAPNQPPDSLAEFISPDRRYRIVVTEELVGFPGADCIKQVYVLPAREAFDRNDEGNEVFVGGCEGLTDVRWIGDRIEGTVALEAVFEGVNALKLKGFAANRKVRLSWFAR